MTQLLDFLAHSFNGGTELDEPLRRCLARVTLEEWKLVSGWAEESREWCGFPGWNCASASLLAKEIYAFLPG